MSYEGLQAGTVKFQGHNGDPSEGYLARPLRAGKRPGVVVIHHMPGWDEWITEVVRKFAHHGYTAIAPNLFVRFGPGSPDDVTARSRPAGGASDAEVMGDVAASIELLRAEPLTHAPMVRQGAAARLAERALDGWLRARIAQDHPNFLR